ncbi:general odorant-binding protein 56d [Zeugodacus cucurbitae]|uniref:General odorant-binding protein 56d n=1 Tax=Zeugodacus cucurbitae TaxID=28588 RepID=A0A0A1WU34_ZEUCU|nr:general odorant-binding protein 56d [Zeugodacus cucurbitae]
MKSNILLAILIALSAVVAAHKSHKPSQAHQFYEECLKESGASPALLDPLKKGDFNAVGDKAKCFLKCLENKKGILENGAPNEADIRKVRKVGNEEPKNILAKCNGLMGANECDTAFLLYKCYWQEHAALI